MSTEHLILCGGTMLSSREQKWRGAKTFALQIGERYGNFQTTGNVNVKFSDIREGMMANLPAIGSDLIDVASYVYFADQASTRGGLHTFEYGEKWRRHFRFEIPVRKPDVWNQPDVYQALTSTLGFISDDDYEFVFSQHPNPPKAQSHFDFTQFTPDVKEVDDVLLFSGGLDSFGGAVDQIIRQKKRVALVSHTPVGKLDKRQRELVEAINEHLPTGHPRPLHVQVEANKDKELNRAYTQRSRSFLYAALGAIVARIFRLDRIHFYENGIISFNLPTSAQVLGGRATRSTHPKTLRGLESLFSLLFRADFKVENPFLWKTKTDVLAEIKRAKVSRLCAQTSSCSHTWELGTEKSHCGRCSQCIDRRLVAVAAGLSDKDDPQDHYKVDVLRGPREEPPEIALVESYVRSVNELDRMESPLQFYTTFPEITRAFRQLELSNDEIVNRAFQLHQRHARQIVKGLDKLGNPKLMSNFRHRDFPPTCLLSLFYQRTDHGPKRTPGGGGLVVDDRTLRIAYKDRSCAFAGRSKLLYCLLREINTRRGSRVEYDMLRDNGIVWVDSTPEYSTISGAISRLRKFLRVRGLSDLADLIETGKLDNRLFVMLKPDSA